MRLVSRATERQPPRRRVGSPAMNSSCARRTASAGPGAGGELAMDGAERVRASVRPSPGRTAAPHRLVRAAVPCVPRGAGSLKDLTPGSQVAFSAGTPVPSGPDQGSLIQLVQTPVTQSNGSLGTASLTILAGAAPGARQRARRVLRLTVDSSSALDEQARPLYPLGAKAPHLSTSNLPVSRDIRKYRLFTFSA